MIKKIQELKMKSNKKTETLKRTQADMKKLKSPIIQLENSERKP